MPDSERRRRRIRHAPPPPEAQTSPVHDPDPAEADPAAAPAAPAGAAPRGAGSSASPEVPTPSPPPRAPTPPARPAPARPQPATFLAASAVPVDRGDDRSPDREAERGLRGLVGAGSSQVSVGAALRARDAARPTDEDLAAAAAELVIVRRGWVPREPLAR